MASAKAREIESAVENWTPGADIEDDEVQLISNIIKKLSDKLGKATAARQRGQRQNERSAVTVNITLIEDSFGREGRHHEQSFNNQTVDVTGGGRITRRSSLGDYETHGYLPWEIVWFGGSVAQLSGVTYVRMVDSKTGEEILAGGFNYNVVATDVPGGVRFQVFQPEQA